ncbi:MAG: DUF2442 domain-containing protein [Tannerella sp.]|jgi:ribosomal protein S1|nr:DUF2442 domain-containing protein [Tannerella sp.]
MKKNSNQNTERTSVDIRLITSSGIIVSVSGCDYYISYDRLPWFRDAKVSDIFNVKMCGSDGIRWEAIDVDLEIESLIHPEQYPLVMKRTVNEVL